MALKKIAVERYHDRVSPLYDGIYEADPYWKFSQEITWRHMKRFLPKDGTTQVLDAGCGTGIYGLRLFKSGYRVTFLDISRKMLDVVEKKICLMAKNGPPYSVIKADICDLKCLKPEFALVIGEGDVLSLCTEPQQALREFHRILRENGIVIASVDNKAACIDEYIEKAQVRELERFITHGTTRWHTERAEERFPVHTFSSTELRVMFEKAGFEVVSMIGKTVLPLRKYKALLNDRDRFNRLLRIEMRLNHQEAFMGRASHLEIVGRKSV